MSSLYTFIMNGKYIIIIIIIINKYISTQNEQIPVKVGLAEFLH
jgi:hypothetical protein